MATRLLVVEADGAELQAIKKMLTNSDFQIRWAPEPVRAKELILAQRYSAVLCDVTLQEEGDGVGFIEWLRGTQEYKSIPVIMMTGAARKETVLRIREVGIQALLVKPFQQRLLMKALASAQISGGGSGNAGSTRRQGGTDRQPEVSDE